MLDAKKCGILLPMRNKSRMVVFMIFAILTGYLAISDSLFLRDCATAKGWVSPDSIYNSTRSTWSGVEKRIEYEFDVGGKIYTGTGFVKMPLKRDTFPIHYLPLNPSNNRTDFPSPMYWIIGCVLSLLGVLLLWQSKWSSELLRYLSAPPSKQINYTR